MFFLFFFFFLTRGLNLQNCKQLADRIDTGDSGITASSGSCSERERSRRRSIRPAGYRGEEWHQQASCHGRPLVSVCVETKVHPTPIKACQTLDTG